MAKAKEDTAVAGAVVSTAPEVHEVALALFNVNWRPNTGFDAWMTAVNCYRAAAEFRAVGEKIAAGMTADDVIAEQQLIAEQRAAAEASARMEKQATADAKAKAKTP